MQHTVWYLEDVALNAGQATAKFAVRAAKAVLIGLVVQRAMRTIDASRDPAYKMAGLPVNQQADYYFTRLLGRNWEAQMERDMQEAVAEVDEGLVSDST